MQMREAFAHAVRYGRTVKALGKWATVTLRDGGEIYWVPSVTVWDFVADHEGEPRSCRFGRTL